IAREPFHATEATTASGVSGSWNSTRIDRSAGERSLGAADHLRELGEQGKGDRRILIQQLEERLPLDDQKGERGLRPHGGGALAAYRLALRGAECISEPPARVPARADLEGVVVAALRPVPRQSLPLTMEARLGAVLARQGERSSGAWVLERGALRESSLGHDG